MAHKKKAARPATVATATAVAWASRSSARDRRSGTSDPPAGTSTSGAHVGMAATRRCSRSKGGAVKFHRGHKDRVLRVRRPGPDVWAPSRPVAEAADRLPAARDDQGNGIHSPFLLPARPEPLDAKRCNTMKFSTSARST